MARRVFFWLILQYTAAAHLHATDCVAPVLQLRAGSYILIEALCTSLRGLRIKNGFSLLGAPSLVNMSNPGGSRPFDPESGPNQAHGHHPFTFAAMPLDPAPTSQGLGDRRPLPNVNPQTIAPVPITSQLQTAAQRRENAKARRRVPSSQRKRTKLSCDACKAKRCKCLRTGLSPEADDIQVDSKLAPCKNCVDSGIDCVTTLPRKQRVYGSVEQLDRRYRALDALVSGLLPDLPHDATPEELIEYGRQRGLNMPDLGPESEASKSPATTISALVSPVSPPNVAHRIGDEGPEAGGNNAHFLKDTSGQSYYIGPSGSLASFARIRDLIARRLHASGDPDATRRVKHLSSKSVTDTIARSFDRGSLNLENMSLSGAGLPSLDLDSMSGPKYWIATSKIKLPSKELADACVNAFYDNVHPDFMLLHRPTFQQHYEDIWRSSGRRSSIPARAAQKENLVSVGWVCCLYMIFILGSRALPQEPDSLDFQRTWYEAVKELPSLLIASTLPNVCALMLLALYFQSTNDRTKSWIYLGEAARLAIALGMHQESADEGMNTVTKEIRKLVWWTLYDFEQHLCCSLGRPSAIDDAEVNIGEPDDRLLQCVPNISPKYMDRWINLIRLQSTVRREVHLSTANAAGIPRAVQLLQQLGRWRREAPHDLAPIPPTRALESETGRWRRITLLHIQHQKVINLLTRRYLLSEVESIDRGQGLGQCAFAVSKLSQVCVTSAMRCVGLLVDLWRAGQFNGATWLDTYYAYLSSTQICLRLLEPSQHNETNAPGSKPQGDDWRFRPHNTKIESESPEPCTELDFRLESVIAQSNLVEEHSPAQLTDAVRQIHDLLKTVPMSGFSAKCEAIASEFGKAIGACDGKPSSTLFGGHLGQMMSKLRGHINPGNHNLSSNAHLTDMPLFNNIEGPGSTLNGQMEELQMPANQGMALPTTTGSNSSVMDYVYSGVLDASSANGFQVIQQPQIQWDMVQPPQEWNERNDQLTDMAANSMFWPFQGELPYINMEPPQ